VRLSAAIKALPVTLQAARPTDEAISSAGGVLFEVLGPDLMLEQLPGVFVLVKCWTGKPPLRATCCKPAWPAVEQRGRVRCGI
jgi:hypothetical protein